MSPGCDLCGTRQFIHKSCYTGYNSSGGITYHTDCDTGGGGACGEAHSLAAEYPGSCLPGGDPGHGSRYISTATLEGWCGYFCGPPAYSVDWNGDPETDTPHGNFITKRCFNHDCGAQGGPTAVGTGPSQGNKFGDLRQCGQDVDIIDYQHLWFDQMIGHCFRGLAAEAGWEPDDCHDSDFGPIAGLGSFHRDGSGASNIPGRPRNVAAPLWGPECRQHA